MRRIIPSPLLSVCAEIIAVRETHPTLQSRFVYAGAPGNGPEGSKPAKALEWLRITNKDESVQPLDVLGRLIEDYMEAELDPCSEWSETHQLHRDRLTKALANYDFQYVRGGKIVGALSTPSRALEQFIRERNIAAIDLEFNRALANVESNPREAVSAASNILESLCKVYIDDEGLEKPAKQDLKPVWTVVRKHLGIDPGGVEDQDLQVILTGLLAIVEGIGALRTHASSAHGAGRKSYKLEPRHARLAIHSAHTVALFVLESWKKKRTTLAATDPIKLIQF